MSALMYHGDPEFLHTPMDCNEYQDALARAMATVKMPVRIGIEIGLGWGASAETFLFRFPEAKLFSLDVNDWLPARKVLENACPHRFHYMNRRDASGLWANDICQWLYIDGDHTKQGVLNDIKEFLPRLQSGGILCFDDYESKECPEVKPAIDEFIASVGGGLQYAGGPTGIVYWRKP